MSLRSRFVGEPASIRKWLSARTLVKFGNPLVVHAILLFFVLLSLFPIYLLIS